MIPYLFMGAGVLVALAALFVPSAPVAVSRPLETVIAARSVTSKPTAVAGAAQVATEWWAAAVNLVCTGTPPTADQWLACSNLNPGWKL